MIEDEKNDGMMFVEGVEVRVGSAGKDCNKEMPKPPKRTKPKVDLREDELKEVTIKVRTSVHESVVQYIAFHEESMGSKPNESKVYDAGMEAFFESDEGFQTYLKRRVKSSNQPVQGVPPGGVVGEGGKVGGQGNVSRSQPGRGTSL